MEVWKSYKAMSRVDWGHKYPLDKAPSNDVLELGALLRLADAVESLASKASALTHVPQITSAIQQLVSLKTSADPDRAKKEREAASRQRAWAAYKAAGGTMEPEGDEAAPADPIAALGLSARARKAIVRLGCQTIADLVKKTADELYSCRNFGHSSLREVKEKLAIRGLSLATEETTAEGSAA